MGLFSKVAESEALGHVHAACLHIGVWCRRILGDRQFVRELAARSAEREKEEKDIEDVVQGFIGRHPELAPERFGIPMERYTYTAFFLAVRAVALLLRRTVRLRVPSMRACVLEEDGTVRTSDGRSLVPESTVVREIGIRISGAYIPSPEEKTANEVKAFRLAEERTSRIIASDARPFLQWVQAALRANPGLLKGFWAWNGSGCGQRILLEESPRDPCDQLELWKRY